jgi:mycothiol synthase
LQVRPYSDADMPRLLRSFSEWIAEAGWCGYGHTGELPHRIYENLRGRRPVGDLVQVWEGGGRIAGIGISLLHGAALDVYTAPSLRGSDAERQMLQVAVRTTMRLMEGSAEPFVLIDVYDCDAVRIQLVRELGFERFRTWENMAERDLRGTLPAPEPDGFLVRSAGPEDADQLAEARNHSFDEDWTGEQYRRAVMDKPGYDPSREIIAEAPDGRISAYTVYWLDERNKIGHFEPVGTHCDFRRRGLGRAVMLHAMRRMQEQGMTLVTVHYLADNFPAHRLYESIGFRKRYETHGFRRDLPRALSTVLAQPHIWALSTSTSQPGCHGSKPCSISQRTPCRLRSDHHARITSRSAPVP